MKYRTGKEFASNQLRKIKTFSQKFIDFSFVNRVLFCFNTSYALFSAMNRQTKIKAQNQINAKELELGYSGDSAKSWHQVYKDSAWIYVGGLDYELNEGDVLSVFSQ
jgi:hypothetical protein